jgi:YidC/Oxa1 family membrane protein insertase
VDDTRRLLIAFLLVFVLLFAWSIISARNKPQPPATVPAPVAAAPVQPAPVPSPRPEVPPAPKLPELLDTLQNAKLRIVFSSYGGTIRSVWLKDYRVELVPDGSRIAGLGLLDGKDYADLSDRDLSVCRMGDTLQYTGRVGDLNVTRTYRLDEDYLLSTDVELSGPNSGYLLLFPSGMALTEPNRGEDLGHMSLLTGNRQLGRYGSKQVRNGLFLGKGFNWIGERTMYFLTAVCPQPTVLDTAIAALLPDSRIGWMTGVKGARTADSYRLYFGPLEYSALSKCRLQAAFDFGRLLVIDLKWIGLPILKLLQFLHSFLKNFGMAIIVFALVIKAIFFPLSRLQYRQMRNMALLQPKLAELKKRYKNDTEGLNRETMQLYRLYKVNPLSGCLPLLIQMPIFFALYQVLRFSVDLRQAQFIFWIKDLSVKDPYYVLPVLMGVFSILQSLLTSAGQQNKALMFMMPIFMTVIFLNFPSGLQLYWLIFNILSIIESLIAQGGIKWRKKPRAPRPATA